VLLKKPATSEPQPGRAVNPFVRRFDPARPFLRQFVPSTKLEWAVIVLIVVILFTLLWPATESAWSGTRVVPVLVEVFDATTGKPVAGARVSIVRSRIPDPKERYKEQFPAEIHDINVDGLDHGVTDESGRVRIKHQFRSGGGQHGTVTNSWVFLNGGWVCVEADGFGGVVVPVRHEDTRTADVIKNGQFQDVYVVIGLFRRPASETSSR
jgi:hypothetical protein